MERLRERLILTALQESEFREVLQKTTTDIRSRAEAVKNEATIESIFEHELYGLLKHINFDFLPEKEVAVDTRRHIGKGRMDSKIGAVVIEYKHHTKLQTTKNVDKSAAQLTDYLSGLSEQNPSYYYGFLTDGLRCKEIIFEDKELLSQSVLVELTHHEVLRLVRNIVLLEKTALIPENLIRDFCYPQEDSLVYAMTIRACNFPTMALLHSFG